MIQKNWLSQVKPELFFILFLFLKLTTYNSNNFYLHIYKLSVFYNLFFIIKTKKRDKKRIIFVQKKNKKRYVYNVKYVLYKISSSINNAIATNIFFRRKKKKSLSIKKFSINLLFIKKYLKKKKITKITKKYKWFSESSNNYTKKPYKVFTLKQRHFIVQKILVRRLFSFLIKHNSNVSSFLKYKFFKKKKVFLANMHKKLAWKMHKARVIHWGFSTKGQLNKYRYNKLLASCLHFLKKNSFIKFLIFLLFNIYTFTSTWKQILLLLKKNLIVYNGRFVYSNITIQTGDIIELPFGACLHSKIPSKTKNYKIHVQKLKKITYKFFKKKNLKNKKIPKIYKKIQFQTKFIKNFLAYDPTLNVVAVINKVPKFNYNLNYELQKSSVIGLQNWRYEFQ